MVTYRFPKHHKPKPPQPIQFKNQNLTNSVQKPKEEEVIIEKPIETKIINGKKIEIYKYRL